MSRSTYEYKIHQYCFRNCIVIKDLDQGGMSVTNNIENVVQEIAARENIDPKKHLIVYRDTEFIWDGWDALLQVFVMLNKSDWRSAIIEMVKRTRVTHHD